MDINEVSSFQEKVSSLEEEIAREKSSLEEEIEREKKVQEKIHEVKGILNTLSHDELIELTAQIREETDKLEIEAIPTYIVSCVQQRVVQHTDPQKAKAYVFDLTVEAAQNQGSLILGNDLEDFVAEEFDNYYEAVRVATDRRLRPKFELPELD